MIDPDVLKHADRNDTIESFINVSIVLQTKFNSSLEAPLDRAVVGGRDLLAGESDTRDVFCARDLRKVNSKPAPARPDVENPKPRLFHEQLRRDMSLLGNLRIVEAIALALKIGARILPVGIEKERIELSIEIVVVVDILPGTFARIELGSPATQIAGCREGDRGPGDGGFGLRLNQVHKV